MIKVKEICEISYWAESPAPLMSVPVYSTIVAVRKNTKTRLFDVLTATRLRGQSVNWKEAGAPAEGFASYTDASRVAHRVAQALDIANDSWERMMIRGGEAHLMG